MLGAQTCIITYHMRKELGSVLPHADEGDEPLQALLLLTGVRALKKFVYPLIYMIDFIDQSYLIRRMCTESWDRIQHSNRTQILKSVEIVLPNHRAKHTRVNRIEIVGEWSHLF